MMHSDPTRSWSELLDLVRRGLMVRTDSRLVREGEVFVAVSGAKVDGADFIPAAIERGAKYIVTSQAERVSTDRDVRVILRPDVPSSLGELADAYFKTSQQHLKVVGITGTNGKT
ncbi:MAG: UDP-N-acetylmuramoyl-L-alanyl-D-glutamate--2,6-diaminopimelate ligase, partial [Proteobacteria bacterium]|nr:UDP-N-acetylmuramoyl-L-alanyl-D-glutamate--2,6-diaminopimelate ligase [Pseudomonadota bacterium]